MTMKPAAFFASILLSTAGFSVAHAQTYQWKDSNGRTVISDTPPPAAVSKESKTIGGKRPPLAREYKGNESNTPDVAGKSISEKDMEFRKRQQEAKDKAEKADKERALSEEKRKNCEIAKRNQTLLESGQPLTTVNDKGENQIMDDRQRSEELERTRRIANDACK